MSKAQTHYMNTIVLKTKANTKLIMSDKKSERSTTSHISEGSKVKRHCLTPGCEYKLMTFKSELKSHVH